MGFVRITDRLLCFPLVVANNELSLQATFYVVSHSFRWKITVIKSSYLI